MSHPIRFGITGFAAAALLAIVAACSSETISFAPATEDAGGPVFTNNPDSGHSPFDGGPVGTLLCASDRCVAPFVTCASSKFPCDTDTSTDLKNCGECGSVVPGDYRNMKFTCSEGKVAIAGCGLTFFGDYKFADCNGIADDGCEIQLGSTDNCNACGDTCAPGVPCVNVGPLTNQCGCPAGKTSCKGVCVDLTKDDTSCGACGNACDDTAPAPPHAYHGCGASSCGKLKCVPPDPPRTDWKDCDGDLQQAKSNGCEVNLFSLDDNNCGACGNKCTGGQHCFYDNATPTCLCAPGKVYCNGACVDVVNDPSNCGGCGNTCLGAVMVQGQQYVGVNSTLACNSGTCGIKCNAGFANCDSDFYAGGCETNILSDPKNCGGCGIQCDGVAGQPCIGGKCATETCGGVK